MKHNKNYLLIIVGLLAILGILPSCQNGMTGQIPKNNDEINSSGINFDGKIFAKTSFAEIVPRGTKAEIFINDDSSWNTYCTGGEDRYISGLYLLKGAFLNGRKVKLSPFALSQ